MDLPRVCVNWERFGLLQQEPEKFLQAGLTMMKWQKLKH